MNANQALVNSILPVLAVCMYPPYVSNFMEVTLKQKLMRMRSHSLQTTSEIFSDYHEAEIRKACQHSLISP